MSDIPIWLVMLGLYAFAFGHGWLSRRKFERKPRKGYKWGDGL